MSLLKKSLSAVSASLIVASTLGTTLVASAASEFAMYADQLAEAEIINAQSTEAGYRLGDSITRAEMVKIAVKVAGGEAIECGTTFSDVTSKLGDLCGYIEAAAEAEIVAMNPKFRPLDLVTRAEMVKMLMAAYGVEQSDVSVFADVPASMGDLAGYINAAAAAGYIRTGTNFYPTNTTTRGEVFKVAAKLLEDSSVEEEEVPPTDETDTTTPPTGGTGTTTPPVAPPTAAGNLEAAVNPSTTIPAGTTLPVAAGIVVGKIDLTAGASDVSVTAVKLLSKGVGARTDIAGVSLFVGDMKVAKSKTISSEDTVDLNMISPLLIKAGATATLNVVVSTAAAAGEHFFQLDKDGITSSAATVSGAFPISTPLFKTSTTSAGTLTFAADGSMADVKLGQTNAILQKFKVSTDDVEDITVRSMTFKKDSSSTAQDSDVTNLVLYMNGSQVAAGTLVNKYVTFSLNQTIIKNKSDVKFEIRGDVVGGAAKTIKFVIDSTTDVSGVGSKYAYGVNSAGIATVTNGVNITAGAVSLVKEDATSDKVMKNKKDIVLGKIKVTANSGKDVELSTMKFTIDTVNDSAVAAATAFGEIENLEIFNETTSQIYDLAYVSGTSSKIYSNTDMGLILRSGTTYSLVIRADSKVAAVDGDYTVKIANATGGDIVMKEVSNDTVISDITPNALSLKKVSIQTSGFTLSQNALSTALNAVIGASEVELINFNIRANDTSDLKVKEIKIAKDAGTATFNNTLVSGFKLYQVSSSGSGGTNTLIKEVGTSDLASSEVTFRDLSVMVPVNTSVKFMVVTSLVKDAGNDGATLKVRVSGYSIEDKDGTSAYDTVADGNSDGVILTGVTSATSGRTITVNSTGSFSSIAVDTIDSAVSKDKNILANTTSDFVAAYKLSALKEAIKIKDLNLTFSSDVSASVSDVILYKGDKTTEIARETVTGANVQFRNISNYVVAEGTESLYVKLITRKIGKNEAGAIALDQTLTLTVVSADGNSSGDAVSGAPVGVATAASKAFSIVPVRVSNVAFVSSFGGETIVSSNALSTGVSQVVGIIAVTADSTSNTSAAGATLKTALTNLEYSLAGTATYAGIKITRINGSDTDGQASNAPTGAASYFDMSALTGGDNLIEGGQTAYFKVEATPTVAAGNSIQLTLPNLDSAVANQGIDYNSDASGHAVSKLNIGMSTITGPTLSRPN